MNKPIFMLDVDGVSNAFDAWISTRDEWMTEKLGRPYGGKRVAPEGYAEKFAAGYRLLVPVDMHGWIAEIEATGFDMVHATMWQDRAVSDLAPVVGWGADWDYIDFHSFQETGLWNRMTGAGVGSYKWPGITDVAGDTPFVWVDDDMEPWQHEWAERRTAAGIPTLFIQPDPAVGMTREHTDQVLAFAAQFATSGVTA